MAKLLKIGIVGCGAIGSSLAKRIAKQFLRQAQISALFDIDTKKSLLLANSLRGNKFIAVKSLNELIQKSDLVIEASSASASWDIAQKALRKKRDIMIMSVGGIIGNYLKLFNLAKANNAKAYIPSGAISGIDALKASALGKIKTVTLTTFKNPLSFQGVKYILDKKIALNKIRKETVLFSGSAKDAVKYFPQNINVAAILSIAGLGAVKTKVRIVASPKISRNIHQIEITSEAGKVFTRTENVLHPGNPKTSYLAFLSAVATLKQILEPVKIGT
ncbi:MAG: aspartate dehydrogenase [Candidatus Omnitrophota bacterium]